MGRGVLLARWLLPSVLRRYRALIVLSVVGVGIFGSIVPLASDAADAAANTRQGLGSPALRAIQVSASNAAATPPEKPLTGVALRQIRHLAGVSDALGWAQPAFSLSTDRDTVAPSLTPRFEALQPKVVRGREPKKAGEVLVSASDLHTLGVKIGATLDASYNRYVATNEQAGVDTKATIVGVYDESTVGLDGDLAAYGAPDWVESLLMQQQGVPGKNARLGIQYIYIYVTATSPDEVPHVVAQLHKLGYTAGSLSSLLSGVQPAQATLNALRVVVASLLSLFLLFSASTSAMSLVVSKRSEIGLLRAFGWQRTQVLTAFLAQFAALGAVIGLLGSLLAAGVVTVLSWVYPDGILGLHVAVGLSGSSIGMFAAFILAPPILYVLAALIPAVRSASIAPDDVLRDLA